MKINAITPNLINYNCRTTKPSSSRVNIETSIYNQKGVTLPFCAGLKPLNICEENCAAMLRKVKEGTHQRFLHSDIKEILTFLRQEKEPKKMENLLGDLIDALGDTEYDKNSFKRIVQLTAGKSDDEQFVILAFVDHELKYATEPLKAFCELPVEKRKALMPFLEKITASGASEDTEDALYDLFRTLVYADEDMSKLSGNALKKYKIDTLEMLKSDVDYFRKVCTYPDEQSKQKVVSTAIDIYHYFTDNMI